MLPSLSRKISGFSAAFLQVALLFLLSVSASMAQKTETALEQLQQKLESAIPEASKALVGMDFGEAGFGSGVIVSKEGLILSACHVTGGINKPFTVILSDGRRVRGITLGLNAKVDAAMAKITTPGEYPYVPVRDTPPGKGSWVFALGHSGGFDPGRGYLARLGKVIDSQENNVRTDCKLIGGDSGGPLFDLDGKLIGIHSRVGQILEDNIHVPISLFKKDWNALLNLEWVEEGPFQQKTPGQIGTIVTETPEGLKLSELSPSEKDLKDGDLLTQWNGKNISQKKELQDLLKTTFSGQKVTLTLKRGADTLQIPFILRTPPDTDDQPPIRIQDFFDKPDQEGDKP